MRLPKMIHESSGLVCTDSGIIWTINDHGDNKLFAINPSAGFQSDDIRFIEVLNITHHDWEDLAKGESENIYIGDFGNNLNRRQDFAIYKINLTGYISCKTSDSLPAVTAELISFHYPDQTQFPPEPANWNFDCEAFFHLGDSLYLFSKNVSNHNNGFTKIYRLSDQPGAYIADLVDSFCLNEPVTGADVSADGKTVVLLTYFSLWFLKEFSGNDFFGGKILQLPLRGLTQKEAVCFSNDRELFITDERHYGKGGKLYKVELAHLDLSQPAKKIRSCFSKRVVYNFFNNPRTAYKKLMRLNGHPD
ncbi:MAG: hypothetical protein ABIQ74_00435 [Chitinophagales bacterium]